MMELFQLSLSNIVCENRHMWVDSFEWSNRPSSIRFVHSTIMKYIQRQVPAKTEAAR
jgi:hypothetical protein